MDEATNHRPLIAAGVLLGVGMGGFLLHQLLQVHNMLSAIRPRTSIVNVEVNMFWDGLFHTFTWLVTALQPGQNRPRCTMIYFLSRLSRLPLPTLPIPPILPTLRRPPPCLRGASPPADKGLARLPVNGER